MLPRFRVFYHSADRPREIIVERLDEAELRVAAGSRLGGYSVVPALSQPRALDASGRPRTDLFVFTFAGGRLPDRFPEGAIVVLETPNQQCHGCKAEWTEPTLSSDELAELRQLLDRDERIAFVRRLREISGIGLSSAKAILDHTDFHVAHCAKCDLPIEPGFRVICSACGGLTYPWHSVDWAPPRRRAVKPEE